MWTDSSTLTWTLAQSDTTYNDWYFSLIAVEEWLSEWLGEDFQLPWDTRRVPWFGCAWHDKNSQRKAAVASGHISLYKVLRAAFMGFICFTATNWFHSCCPSIMPTCLNKNRCERNLANLHHVSIITEAPVDLNIQELLSYESPYHEARGAEFLLRFGTLHLWSQQSICDFYSTSALTDLTLKLCVVCHIVTELLWVLNASTLQ